MTIRWSYEDSELSIDGLKDRFVATSDVRNEINGRRKLGVAKEVVRAVVNGQWGPPYMPRHFPFGTWDIVEVEPITDRKSEFWPIKIRTTAHQLVKVWRTGATGGYLVVSPETVDDSGYHLHWTPSKTTLGCIRIGTDSPEQIRALAGYISAALDKGEHVTLIAGS